MWLLVSCSNAEEKHTILGDKKYVVGRTGCDIAINDPSVSRKQALIMMAHYEANVVKSFITPSLTLEDTSKFGTFVNGESVKKKPGSMVTLKDGDKIQFGGAPASFFLATYKPFVVTTSCLEKAPKKNLQHVMCLLGGHVVREWRGSCDLLIMAKINVTIKVICAINNQKHIVTPDYLDHFHQYLTGERDNTPDPHDYLPEVVDKEVPVGVSFHPDSRRATLLKDLKFYFLSAHQFNKTNLAVSTAGGLPILLEDGTEEDADLMTQDCTIVVAVSRDVLSSLSATCQKFVRTVYLALKKKNLRMVTDPEIGWAILTCKTDDFCNPKSAITPSMYSSMASQSLSQMTEVEEDLPHNRDVARMMQTRPPPHATATEDSTQLGTDGRCDKRPASAMDEGNEEEPHSHTLLDGAPGRSLHSPAEKRFKTEPLVSQSQDSLFETGNKSISPVNAQEPGAKPLFKSPSPLPPKKRDDLHGNQSEAVEKKNEEDEHRIGNNLLVSSKEQSKVASSSPQSSRAGNNDQNNISNVSAKKSFNASVDLLGDSPGGNNICDSQTSKKNLNSSRSNLSTSKFLSKRGNKNSTFLDDALSTEKHSCPSSSSSSSVSASSTKKRKKRALFSESLDGNDNDDDNDDGMDMSHLLKKSRLVDVNVDGNESLHEASIPNATTVDVKEPAGSSVVCNGDTGSHNGNGKRPATSNQVSPLNANGESHPPITERHGWTTVKKEEVIYEDGVNDEEQKHNTELLLDAHGQPLRHLCEVKVVKLVARAPRSQASRTATASQPHLNGLKNFKQFKKTPHRGSGGLPTIIGGSDLAPHKGTRLIHREDLMEAAPPNQNGVEDKDDMFRWDDDTTSGKRRTKRK